MGSISLEDFKIHFKNTNVQESYLIEDLMEESLRMCDLCLSLLSDIYKTLKKLTHQATLTQQVQNLCTKGWKICTEVNPLAISVENEDLFDEFNHENDHSLDQVEDCFTEECKYETSDDPFENESLSVPQQDSTPIRSKLNDSPEKLGQKKALRFSKELVVKVEKISNEDLEHYNEKKRTKADSSIEVVLRKGRKLKSVQKLHSTALKRKYSRQHGKETSPIPKDKRKYECKICGKVFTDIKSFRKHMKLVHKQASEEYLKRNFKTCEICGKTMKSLYLKSHMEIHGPRKTLKCNKCDKEYLKKSAYEAHLLTHSDNFIPYLCRHCGSAFNDRHSLYIHERRHTEGKKFSCEICSKNFFLKAELKMHMTVHSKERPFVCDECGLSYRLKDVLKRHMRIHEDVAEKGEYSAKCKYCKGIFKHSDSLQRHMRIHEKNFKSSFCGKILSTALRLRKHETLHANDPDYQPRRSKLWISNTSYQLKSSSEIK